MHRTFVIANLLVLTVLSFIGTAQDNDTKKLRKLNAFARTFGYVRYFHPSDQATLIDWESMAYWGTKQVLESSDDETVQKMLTRLFNPIVVDLQVYSGAEKPRPKTEKVDADKIVAWQHSGIGFGQRGLYNSVRLNRSVKVANRASGPFGNLMSGIDPTDIQGKEIRFRFDAKIEEGDCRLQGWWRADKKAGGSGLFENMGDRPIRSKEWKEYELTGTVDDDANRLTIGVMFFGTGSALVDNVHLEQKDGDNWKALDLPNADFETGESKPQSWAQPVRGYSMEIATEDVSSGKQSVRIMRGTSTRNGGKIFEMIPELGEVIDAEVTSGVRVRLPLALELKTKYKSGDDQKIDSWIETVNETDPDDANPKIANVANVVLLWNVFQHFYPYFEQVETDWDNALKVGLKNGLAASDRATATKNLKWIVAQLHDGHGYFFDPKEPRKLAAVKFGWIEDQLAVTFSDNEEFKIGDVVTTIDGKPSIEYLNDVEKYKSGSPQWKRYQSANSLSVGDETKSLKLVRGDQTLDVELKYDAVQPATPDKGEVCRIEVDAEEDSDDIWYIDMGRAEPKDINDKLPKLAKAQGIVLDFRGYPRGTQYLFQHMTDQHMQSQKWQVPQQVHPDRIDMQEIETMGRWEMPPRKPRFKGKMVFITNASAISYAESCMAIVANYKLGEIIGSPTAGANGNINPFNLPGGYRISWTGMRVMNHDDSQHHVRGVQPTLPMKPTLAGIRAGKDELLDKAIQLIGDARKTK